MNNAAIHSVDDDMKIVPSKINERGKVQQSDEKQRKIKTLKTKILQNVSHKNRAFSDSSPPPSFNEMTDEQHNTNNNNNNNNSNNDNSSTKKTNCSETSKEIEVGNNANVIAEKSLTTSKDIQSAQNNLCNNNNNKIDKNSNSELIIAEAAKIILKNGLNGTNAAAAAAVVLTAAVNFQLPCGGNGSVDVPSTSKPTTAAAATAQAQLAAIAAAAAAVNVTNKQNCFNSSSSPTKNDHNATTTAAGSPTINTTASSTTTNNEFDATGYTQNNSSTCTSNANITQYQFTKPSQLFANNSNSTSAMDMGVIDYTINNDAVTKSKTTTAISLSPISASTTPSPPSLKNNSNNNCKQPLNYNKRNVNGNNNHHGYDLGSLCGSGSDSVLKNNSHHRCDRGGGEESPLAQYASQFNGGFHSWNKFDLTGSSSNNNSNHSNGGRLQFFKDGKFILELARARDGEKGRWVYVPRKHFRAPSAATSSTITPCASIFSAAAAAVPPALPASPVTVAAVVAGGFPKNECSNSLSFSDDNSSIQSSPWQRDHCFKQSAPQKNISKEMSHYYQRPYFKKLSPQALIKARKKFRKPYNVMTITHDLLYINNNKIEENVGTYQDKNDEIMKDAEINENECHKSKTTRESVPSTGMNQSDAEVKKLTIIENETTVLKCDDNRDVDRTDCCDRVGDGEDVATDGVIQDNKQLPNVECKGKINEINLNENSTNLKPINITQLHSTRRKLMTSCKTKGKLLVIVQKLTDMCKQRLSKVNTIASKALVKTAPQSSSSSVSLVVASTDIGSMQNIPITTVSHNSKVSPSAMSSTSSSNTAASRLVDYHHQHVSPRKRILREMEKVSLEDSGAVGTAKRSRAKRYNNASTTANTITTISNSPQNAQLKPNGSTYQNKATLPVSNCNSGLSAGNTDRTNIQSNPPPTKVYSSYSIHSLLSSHGGSNNSNSGGGGGSIKSRDSSPNNHPMQDNAYHIHNIVQPPNALRVTPKSPENYSADSKSSNCIYNKGTIASPYASPSRGQETRSQSPAPVSTSNMGDYINYGRRTPDAAHKLRYTGHSTEHISSNYNHPHHQHQQQQHYLHHTPLVAHQQTYYSPYMTSPQYVPTPNKISPRNTSSPISPISSSSSVASNNSSTHTPSSAATTIKSNSSSMAYMGCRSRSPHRHPSAFRSTTSNMGNTCTTVSIPIQKDYSPTRSIPATSGSSTRDYIPRTVPKKTASIRRQFASPSISCGSGDGPTCNTANAAYINSNNNNHHNNKRNSSSPILNENRSNNESSIIYGGSHSGNGNSNSNNNDNSSSSDRQQLPISLMHQQQQPAHMLPRSSPSLNLAGMACSSLYSYPYQMYISPAAGNNGDAQSPRNSSTAHNVTVQPSQSQPQPAPSVPPPPPPTLPLSSPYIPTVVGSPYYHPYISTLAAMRHPQIWMQHYQNTAPALLQARHSHVSSLTNSRLATSPYHGFHYNGTMTNALAAAVAAAAAAGFGNNALPAAPPATANQHQAAGLLPLVALPQNTNLFNHPNGSSFVDNMSHTLMGMTGTNVSTSTPSTSTSTSSISNTCITPNTLMTDRTIIPTTTTKTTTTTTVGNSSSLSSSSLQTVMASSIGNDNMSSLYAYNHSNKDEQSSDVPLNLSKH